MAAGFQAIVSAASTPNRSILHVRHLEHHGGMIYSSGVGTEGGIRAGGEVFCSMRFLASINHGDRCRPMATTGPHSRRESIQQSADMLGNRLVSLKLEKNIIKNYH
jgi:hypothetical protein